MAINALHSKSRSNNDRKTKTVFTFFGSNNATSIQIGKNGLENSVIDSARAALMARELIKVKLHNNSPEDKTIFQELADMLGAELVQVIGFNGVLYKAKKEPKIILPK